jgi:hypothetical protein
MDGSHEPRPSGVGEDALDIGEQRRREPNTAWTRPSSPDSRVAASRASSTSARTLDLPNCGYDALSEFRWSEGRWMYQVDRNAHADIGDVRPADEQRHPDTVTLAELVDPGDAAADQGRSGYQACLDPRGFEPPASWLQLDRPNGVPACKRKRAFFPAHVSFESLPLQPTSWI